MRKARLGFEIYSLDDELLVEEEVDFVRREKDKKLASRRKELARKKRCWDKKKDEYNQRRREKAASIRGRFLQARSKALARGDGWNLTQSEWESIWIDAGFVIIPGTMTVSNPRGVRKPAYALRGPNRFENTMMARSDLSEAWSIQNCYIVYREAPLIGSIYHAESN